MPRTIRNRVVGLAVLAVAALALSGCGQGAAQDAVQNAAGSSGRPDKLVFAAVPGEEATGVKEDYGAVLALIEDETGLPVTIRKATSYAAVIEAQLAGKVDIAAYGPFSYVIAKGRGANVAAIATRVPAPDAESGYKSFGITRTGSPIDSLADFKGKTICFVDPNSTSGYLFPTAALIEVGINPETEVNGIFAGSHDASVLNVASGQCDAGFAFDAMVTTLLIEEGSLQPGEIKVVWKSETIPGSPVAISTALPEDLQQTITDAFVHKANVDYLTAHGYCKPQQCFGGEDAWGYVPVDDSFYDPVRKVCKTTETTLGRSCSSSG